MIPRDTTGCGITDFWVVSLWWYHELMVFNWRYQAQARAGGILLVVSYWWNHSIRCPQARAASPCSVNPNLVAGHELFHTTVSHPFAGGMILVVSYWWNHSIRCLLARDASPCSVNPNLVAGHELLHTIVSPSICCFKKYAPQSWHLSAHRPGFEPGSQD